MKSGRIKFQMVSFRVFGIEECHVKSGRIKLQMVSFRAFGMEES
jgi:hypothetical protein